MTYIYIMLEQFFEKNRLKIGLILILIYSLLMILAFIF